MNRFVRAHAVAVPGERRSAPIKSNRAVHLFDARARPIGAVPRADRDITNRSCCGFLSVVMLAAVVLLAWVDQATAQEVALTPLQATEVARGYRADSLKLKQVVNEKNETIGRVNDFIFGKDGNIYAVLAVGGFTGLNGQVIAVPFRSLKIDDQSENILLPGASRSALEKLPVFLSR